MGFVDFVRDIFGKPGTYDLTYTAPRDARTLALCLSDYSIAIAQDYLSALVSKCRVRTYMQYKELRGEEWYLLNISPNPHENATEFWAHVVKNLLQQGEALVVEVGGNLYVAESFDVSDAALFPAYFTSVEIRKADGTRMTLQKSFQAADVLHFRLSDRYKTSMLRTIEKGFENLVEMSTGKYKRLNGRKGIIKMNRTASGDKEERERQQKIVTEGFKSYFDAENGLVMLPNGMEYTELQNPASTSAGGEITAMTALIQEALRTAARAYRIPAQLLLNDVADTSAALKVCISQAVTPITDIIAAELTRKRFGKEMVLKGSYATIDTNRIISTSIFDFATQSDKLLSSGILSIDEIRDFAGLEPLNTAWSKKHFMTKNYDVIEGVTGPSNKARFLAEKKRKG